MSATMPWVGDERAAAWAAYMCGGAEGADAPRMRQPPADDGMTHRCDGCAGGAPCPSCGGNISKLSAESPEPWAQSLDTIGAWRERNAQRNLDAGVFHAKDYS